MRSISSFASCDITPELFCAMFRGETSDSFSMSRTMLSKLVSDGLSPYYRKEICDSIRGAEMPFTIKCDETGNVQKEDVLTRYWSPEWIKSV